MVLCIVGNKQKINSGRSSSIPGAEVNLASRRNRSFGERVANPGSFRDNSSEFLRAGYSVGNYGRLVQARVCFLSLIGLLILVSVSPGCKKKAAAPPPTAIQSMAKLPASSPSAPPAITPVVDSSSKSDPIEAAPAPKVAVAPSDLDLGITSFQAGEYGKAAQLFEEYLQDGAIKENRDFALFHLYLSRKLMGNSGRNARRAEEALKRIVTEFPKSPYRDAAEYILSLQAQIENLRSDSKEKDARIKQLSDELQKLKDIDMQRRPSRPLY